MIELSKISEIPGLTGIPGLAGIRGTIIGLGVLVVAIVILYIAAGAFSRRIEKKRKVKDFYRLKRLGELEAEEEHRKMKEQQAEEERRRRQEEEMAEHEYEYDE